MNTESKLIISVLTIGLPGGLRDICICPATTGTLPLDEEREAIRAARSGGEDAVAAVGKMRRALGAM